MWKLRHDWILVTFGLLAYMYAYPIDVYKVFK